MLQPVDIHTRIDNERYSVCELAWIWALRKGCDVHRLINPARLRVCVFHSLGDNAVWSQCWLWAVPAAVFVCEEGGGAGGVSISSLYGSANSVHSRICRVKDALQLLSKRHT